MGRIVILGGYGAFGAHAAERLARDPATEIVIAGRSRDKARAQAAKLITGGARARIEFAELDAMRATGERLRALGADVIINASGPFQAQDYSLARAAIAARCHYIDLADARAFVCGIGVLDDEARAAGVRIISGASSVPGLSSAVVRCIGVGLELDQVHIGISPGNSFDPGVATVASIISAVGKPFTRRADGRASIAHGWQGLHRHRFAEIGARWMGDVDVPDLELLPVHYPQLSTVRFTAGLEVSVFHLGLWCLSWLGRAGVLGSGDVLGKPLLAAKRRLSFLGSDCGGMFVHVAGRDSEGNRRERVWNLIARRGHGPYVPAIASVVLAKQLLAGSGPPPGAMPCFQLFTPADFEAEARDLDIRCFVDREG
ncbi:Saccharopine dehydrogenase NADP-binding domain-containing protein [Hyphomicrobium sp. 1Nfss2.1]|uniref:saccharopine dehydrogenase family protein n=1 Tax=Hyphomicrobium sp. 1Nfss2.1 TaxID=3413936 RepID=UPI003C7D4462